MTARNSSVFFPGKPNYINRGISGQTTLQMLVRFRQDVIDLHPAVVIILAGTNDIAGNMGPASLHTISDTFSRWLILQGRMVSAPSSRAFFPPQRINGGPTSLQ